MSRDGGAAALPAPLSDGLLSFLPKPLTEPRRAGVAILAGWPAATLPALLLAFLLNQIAPAAEQPSFDVSGPAAVLMLSVFAPFVETLIMGGVLAILLRIVSPGAAVIISAIGWGVAHSLVAPVWGLVIWWPFLIFSALFVTWRQRSLLAALAIPAVVHGLHNLPAALLIASGV